MSKQETPANSTHAKCKPRDA